MSDMSKNVTFLLILLAVGLVFGESNKTSPQQDEVVNGTYGKPETEMAAHPHGSAAASHKQGHKGFHIVAVNWHHVQVPFSITLWLLLAGVAKIAFHLSKKFASVFPDSSLLIGIGLIVGIALYFAVSESSDGVEAQGDKFHLKSELFFLYLLPPIVFDAGYFMPNRAFFGNLGSILVYAVIGTLWNTLAIGLSLWGCGIAGAFAVGEIKLLNVLVFSSLISAVDPVAVLCVFEEIHVNELLYIIVFGESLLNDAVSVVLYNMFKTFVTMHQVTAIDGLKGIVSFFVVALGGVAVGLVWAAGCSWITKYTKHVRVLEPLFIFISAYGAYLTGELFHLSGILAIVFCGIAMREYVEWNISANSRTTVIYFLKMLSSCTETIIFMFLGLSTVSKHHVWDTGFVCLTVFFCLVYRALGTIVLTFMVNKFRLVKLLKVEQFIMAYGGLRGAIAYGLVSALDEKHIKEKNLFTTATIVVIFFTVFLQGMTIKPLVNWLKVKKQVHREKSLLEHSTDRCISGQGGHQKIRARWEDLDNRFFRRWFMRNPPAKGDIGIVKSFEERNMREAEHNIKSTGSVGGGLNTSNSVSQMIRKFSKARELDKEGANGTTTGSSPAVLDMGAIEAGSGGERAAELRMHHLLDDSFFKPKHRYSRNREFLEDPDDLAFYHKNSNENPVDTRRFAMPYNTRKRSRAPKQRSRLRSLRDQGFSKASIANDAGMNGRSTTGVADKSKREKPKLTVKFHDDETEKPQPKFTAGTPASPTSSHSPTNTFTFPAPQAPARKLTAVERELPWHRPDFESPPRGRRSLPLVGPSPATSPAGSELDINNADSADPAQHFAYGNQTAKQEYDSQQRRGSDVYSAGGLAGSRHRAVARRLSLEDEPPPVIVKRGSRNRRGDEYLAAIPGSPPGTTNEGATNPVFHFGDPDALESPSSSSPSRDQRF